MNITVCIGTYESEDWLLLASQRALPSAKAQTDDVLMCHDSSGATIASVRNRLAEDAKGDWLLFLDADDELAPGYLDAMEQAYAREREYDRGPFLLTPAVSYVRKGRAAPARFNDRGIPLSKDNWLVVGTLIERDLFMKVGGFSDYPHGFEDWSLWYKAEKAGARVVKVRNAVYIAHINPRSKHRLGWRDKRWQVETHQRVERELAAWTP